MSHNIWNPSFGRNVFEKKESGDVPLSPDLLISKLNGLSMSPQYTNFVHSLDGQTLINEQLTNDEHENYTFHLPPELQGGVSNINSRRPSFAAEQMLMSSANESKLQYNDQFSADFIPQQFTHTNLVNFQSRRPSIQVSSAYSWDPMAQQQYIPPPPQQQQLHQQQQQQQYFSSQQPQQQQQQILELDNGLLLNAGVIISSLPLQQTYQKTSRYFCASSANALYLELRSQLESSRFLQKVVMNLKKLNNMFSLMKTLVLVLTKSGKYEILSMPMNSNMMLQQGDVVIVDGDRGKDLVYVLDPMLSLDLAILINYLKKRQHAKSISYGGTVNNNGLDISNTAADLVKGQGILDDETQFQIPSKQVLRFATFQEVGNLQFKLIEEIKSFKTSLLKISNQPLLNNNLTILSSEYQFDQKKLTFFYCSSQRLDFRNLIKELFKIYKTRIWLCAVPKPGNGLMNLDMNNDTKLEECNVDDFHVRNFRGTLKELINES